MQNQDIHAQFEAFFAKAEEYLESARVMDGLQLDQMAGRLRPLCLTQLKDEPLARCLEQVLSALRRQDASLFARLLGEIRQRAAEHGVGKR